MTIIKVAKSDYENFKNALNKIEEFNSIMDRVCMQAVKNAVESGDFKNIKRLTNDTTVSEVVRQEAVESFDKFKSSKQEVSEVHKHSADDDTNDSTKDDSFDHNQNLTVKEYVASMLLQFAVLDSNLSITKLLLTENYKADPRIEDSTTHTSAVIEALDSGNLKLIKLFNSCKYIEPQSIAEDYFTISSIYKTITSDHEYDSQELLGALDHLYSDVDSIFS